ncbi:hypothetical protein [Emticicia agri]|uniref:DUF1496 domain-containing protein n=1 Tax=Emticicia agri TaxID=2492393 RepID=A0A4Q5M2P5_9BACT|nr:hypothetical protein [Emticicia agri]RYU96385.1 hypothetical protein EWM59_07695 [Emticicia agri]
MKKIAVLFLISIISSSGAFAKSAKPTLTKKASFVAGCTSYPVYRGKVVIGDDLVCVDKDGKTTVIRTRY